MNYNWAIDCLNRRYPNSIIEKVEWEGLGIRYKYPTYRVMFKDGNSVTWQCIETGLMEFGKTIKVKHLGDRLQEANRI